MSKVRMQKRKAVLQKIIVSFDTLMRYVCLLCAFWHIARTCFARCWLARLFVFIHMSVTVMLHVINQAIQSINQSNKQIIQAIQSINQSIKQTNQSCNSQMESINQTNQSYQYKKIDQINEAITSINQCLCMCIVVCVCMCLWYVHVECVVCLHPNQTQQTNQINHIKHTKSMESMKQSHQTINACACALCVHVAWSYCMSGVLVHVHVHMQLCMYAWLYVHMFACSHMFSQSACAHMAHTCEKARHVDS